MKREDFRSESEYIEHIFTYHPASDTQVINYEAVRKAARVLAETILICTPKCADQSAAIRLVREAVMTANAAIALKGLV